MAVEEMNVDWDDRCNVSVLLGKTLTKVEMNKNEDIIHFHTSEGEIYQMWHLQDCCEGVYVEDIVGDLQDLVGTPITLAEEVEGESGDDAGGTFTWTFYKFATIKGYVDIRWYGSSNGYYSESVSFGLVKG